MNLRAWITVGRPHTAALTIAGVLLGATLAYHETHTAANPLMLLNLALWALAFHWVGFLHNNLMDLPWDKKDPTKHHFPLVSGTVPTSSAWEAWRFGLLFILIYGIILAWANAAIVALTIAISAGVVYNLRSKRSLLAPLWISLSFASLPAYAYLTVGGPITSPLLWYIVTYAFFLMLAEIAVFGYLKDLATDPVNLLATLGSRVDHIGSTDYYDLSYPAFVLSALLLFSLIPLALVFIALTAATWILIPFFTLLALLRFATGLFAVENGSTPTRPRRILLMSLSEVFAYWLLIVSLQPALGWWLVAVFILLPLVWFITMNRLIWNTWIAPRV